MVYRLNGIRQEQATIYSSSFISPPTPVPKSIQVGTVWQFPHSLGQSPNAGADLRLEHEFRHHWNAQVDLTYGNNWNQIRERNINAPMVASSNGVAPDPITALLAPRPSLLIRTSCNTKIRATQVMCHQTSFPFSHSVSSTLPLASKSVRSIRLRSLHGVFGGWLGERHLDRTRRRSSPP